MIGLLLDSLSPNTGDQAIVQVMVEFLRRNQFDVALLSPLDFDPQFCEALIIGGGHLLRDRGDWFYDAFRVPGRLILNTQGVTTTSDLAYLADYAYVSVRSQRDLVRVVSSAPEAVVCPCVSLVLEPDNGLEITPEGCIGFQFHEGSWAACGDETLFLEFKDYRQALIPITHYNGDHVLLAELYRRTSLGQTLIPRLPPKAVLGQIARMRALVTSSLHGAIFAYSRNVPFLAFGHPDKMVGFMEDRGLEEWVFRDRHELRTKLAALLNKPPDYTSPLL